MFWCDVTVVIFRLRFMEWRPGRKSVLWVSGIEGILFNSFVYMGKTIFVLIQLNLCCL